jgi:1-deoxy-D-xylulose-5-phosphate synthase
VNRDDGGSVEHVFDDSFSVGQTDGERRIRVAAIDDPSDLRGLSVAELCELAADVRRFLIEYASDKGGHFAPSLGTVELTLALHHVFETPRDLIVWDTGHQAYVHKLLTGRRDRFPTLRRYGGLSGFLKRDESPYDTFGAGHASTSVSAAFGMATGRDLRAADPKQQVIAVIGDGAMTGGLAFEALNNAGAAGRDLIVVLNDNAMSISPNVGAVAHYLTSLTTHPYYRRMKSDIGTMLGRLPKVAQPVGELARRTMQGIKGALVPGALFEALGFNYIGPIDGHDMAELVDVLTRIKGQYDGPVLLHVLTHKGKGYAPAEADPLKWHGVTPFDPATGKAVAGARPAPPRAAADAAVKPPPSYTAAFGDAITDLARRHADVVAISAAMCPGTGLTKFQDAYPERFFDVGIAEAHGITFAAGLATQGIRPVCAIYSTFLQRAFDNIVHDVALQHLPVVFALDRGGLAGADGPTHHGTFDLTYMRLIPGMVVSAPKDADELADLLETAHAHTAGPFSIRYPRDDSPAPRTREPRVLPLGSWETLAEGDGSVALLAVGTMVPVAQGAARALRAAGIDATVINARFVKPLDLDLLRRVAARVRLCATLEENTLRGGFGGAVHEASVEHGLDLSARLLHFGLPDRFVTHGSREELLAEVGLTAQDVAGAIAARLRG